MSDNDYVIHPDDDPKLVSFEAANAVPLPADELDDEQNHRPVIDLDAPVEGAHPVFDGDGLGSPAAKAGADELHAQVAQAQEAAEQANDKYLRTLAEFQNYRRRSDEEVQRRIREGNERLIKEILPTLDEFDLALNAAQKAESYEQLISGVEAILRKFRETLAKQGVEPIPALGEPFDHDLHEAVMLDEESEEPDETVTAELRKGYTMHGRVIRPSLVKVAKGG